ncbi:hypothetical protein NDN08_003422 [Rhodosorus marinus]|uniref:H/ACA ribonucleoprotein complex non-core subunit NAF1 n=1 Tax=Rhodosorus marinus TaxID=101924 RepID=A0AAV8UY08_9RHOD|nr:hypothetical protein NDN08_003422 [Rhodosorus marinus]
MEEDPGDEVMESGGGVAVSPVEKKDNAGVAVKETGAADVEVLEEGMVADRGARVMDLGDGGAVNPVADAEVAVMGPEVADVEVLDEGMVADRGDDLMDSGGGDAVNPEENPDVIVVAVKEAEAGDVEVLEEGMVADRSDDVMESGGRDSVNPVQDLDVAVVAVKEAETADVEVLEEGMEDVNGKAAVRVNVGEHDSEQAENKDEGPEVEVVNEDEVSGMNGADSGVGSDLKACESSPANENTGAGRAEENSSSSSDEDESSESSEAESESVNGEIIKDDAFMDDLDGDENGTSSVHPPKTKHELSVEDIGPVEKLRMSIEESLTILPLGNVRCIVDGLAVVEGIHPGATPTLDEGSVLCESSRGFLGSVFETFGPVSNPFYTFRVHDEDKERVAQGTEVFYVKEEAGVVVTEALRSRGCDASNIYDEEIPMEAQEASDDELEAGRKSGSKRRNAEKQGGRLERRPSRADSSRGRGSVRNVGRQFRQRGGMPRGQVAPPGAHENVRTYADPGVAQLPGMPYNPEPLHGIQPLHQPPQPQQPRPPYSTMMGAPMMPFAPPMPGFGIPGHPGTPQPGPSVVPPAPLLNLVSQIRAQGGSLPNGGLPVQAYGTGVIPSQAPISYDGHHFPATSQAGQVFPPGLAAQGAQSQTQPSAADASGASTHHQAQQGPAPDQIGRNPGDGSGPT